MAPIWIALLFAFIATCAAYGLAKDVTTGMAQDEIYRFSRADSSLGYMSVLFGKLFVLAFCLAEILHQMNLCGDPMILLHALFGNLPSS